MSELAKCLRCEKLFTRVKLPVCGPCEAKEDIDIHQVSSYLRENPNESMEMVSDALNIYLEDIFRWIEEKRLRVHVNASSLLQCEVCGVPIVSGRMCINCKSKLFTPGTSDPSSPQGGGEAPNSFRDRGTGGKYRR